jgi:H+/Cl- antiporter ClcA
MDADAMSGAFAVAAGVAGGGFTPELVIGVSTGTSAASVGFTRVYLLFGFDKGLGEGRVQFLDECPAAFVAHGALKM